MSWLQDEKVEVKVKFEDWWKDQLHKPRPQWWVAAALVVGLLVGLILGG